MRKIILLILALVFAMPQALFAAPVEQEPGPTPIIEAPPAPPLAISPPADEVEEIEDGDRSLFLLILIIVVSSATALAIGFYAYRKIRQFLEKRKKKKAAKQVKE